MISLSLKICPFFCMFDYYFIVKHCITNVTIVIDRLLQIHMEFFPFANSGYSLLTFRFLVFSFPLFPYILPSRGLSLEEYHNCISFKFKYLCKKYYLPFMGCSLAQDPPDNGIFCENFKHVATTKIVFVPQEEE